MNNKVIDNIRQQTKRLLDQLEQLEANREELTEQEYQQMKQSTHADLQTFQNFLINMQKGDQILDSQIEKSKKQLRQAVKKSINKKQVMAQLMQKQAKSLRNSLEELQKSYQIKKISDVEYSKKKRNLLVEIQQTGCELNEQQKQWLQLNHFDESKGMSKQALNKNMQIAQEGIKKLQ